MPLKLWKPILSNSKFKFVSLQYGDDYPHIQRFCESSGLQIHHDHDVDPSKDMDRWLSQVDAMDCVVSVANTTIHGAGNLNKELSVSLAMSRTGDGLIKRFSPARTGILQLPLE